MSIAEAVSAGVRCLPELAEPFAATQAAWRFYSNPRITLSKLAEPIIGCARSRIAATCDRYALVALDWSFLHLTGHGSRTDRIALSQSQDLGYDLLTALAISDSNGHPLAPVALELQASNGVHSTRSSKRLPRISRLDRLPPLMAHVAGLNLGREPVFILDREADSVGHLRRFVAKGMQFLIRADDQPHVDWQGQRLPLGKVAGQIPLAWTRTVQHQGQEMRQYVGQTGVTLRRPARTHRVARSGEKVHKNIAGVPIDLRLVVSELRDKAGQVVARWLLLTTLPPAVEAAIVALWYYWRWRIESYHKLIKGAGMQLEHWQQETAETFSRRLLVAAMAVTLVWQLAAGCEPQAQDLRQVLVRLSGRQIKRGKGRPTFTIPALLAGLNVLMPILCILEQTSAGQLIKLARRCLPSALLPAPPPPRSG